MGRDTSDDSNGNQPGQLHATFTCEQCGTAELHTYGPEDAALSNLAGFDLVRASNILLKLPHGNHDSTEREKAARKAYLRVLDLRRTLVPERLAQREYLKALESLRATLVSFERATAKQVEAEWQLPGRGAVLGRALSLTGSLRRVVRWLVDKYSFTGRAVDLEGNDFGLSTLPGTIRDGRKGKMASAEVYAILAGGGFSQKEIARLDLDGSLERDENTDRERALESAHQRVRDALRSHRRRAEAIEASVDREQVKAWAQQLRAKPKDPVK